LNTEIKLLCWSLNCTTSNTWICCLGWSCNTRRLQLKEALMKKALS